MSLFSAILNKLGFGDKPQAATAAPADVTAANAASDAAAAAAAASAAEAATAAPVAISEVDVVAQLEARAANAGQPLNWRQSIVDLLKLLDLDSSLDARKGLATELGCPADKMAESAQMNMWLHKTVLQRLAANGGNIPAELL